MSPSRAINESNRSCNSEKCVEKKIQNNARLPNASRHS